MSGGGQNSNPWSTYGTRGAGAGPTGQTTPVNPNPYNANPFSTYGNRGAGAGTGYPGSGVSPGGPTTTMPGSIDPRFLGGLETGGTSPVPTQPNPTLSQPTMSTGFRVNENPMNKPYSPSGQYHGQAWGGNGPGSFSGNMQPMDDQGFARSMYTGLLGRDPTADEVTNATTALQTQYGGDRNALANFFRGSDEFKGSPNAYGGPGAGAPYDPRTPGYQRGAGWQTMLRQYAGRDGMSNPNQYITDRGLTPMWGQQQQPWEPQALGGSLSQLLRGYRGY